jgi:hypothetical protein
MRNDLVSAKVGLLSDRYWKGMRFSPVLFVIGGANRMLNDQFLQVLGSVGGAQGHLPTAFRTQTLSPQRASERHTGKATVICET